MFKRTVALVMTFLASACGASSTTSAPAGELAGPAAPVAATSTLEDRQQLRALLGTKHLVCRLDGDDLHYVLEMSVIAPTAHSAYVVYRSDILTRDLSEDGYDDALKQMSFGPEFISIVLAASPAEQTKLAMLVSPAAIAEQVAVAADQREVIEADALKTVAGTSALTQVLCNVLDN